MSTHKIKHLVLSGGGLLGISYIGLFKYFEEHKTLSNIKSITGCSAGAIFGSLLSIGYTYKELDIIVKSMIFKDYLKIRNGSLCNQDLAKNLIGFDESNIMKESYSVIDNDKISKILLDPILNILGIK